MVALPCTFKYTKQKMGGKNISVLVDKGEGCVGITHNIGMLPLHIALRKMQRKTADDKIVRTISKAFTETLDVRDPGTHL